MNFGDGCREFGVEGMYAFHHQDAARPHLKGFATIVGVAFDEVECGDFDLFALDETLEVVVEKGKVEGID